MQNPKQSTTLYRCIKLKWVTHIPKNQKQNLPKIHKQKKLQHNPPCDNSCTCHKIQYI